MSHTRPSASICFNIARFQNEYRDEYPAIVAESPALRSVKNVTKRGRFFTKPALSRLWDRLAHRKTHLRPNVLGQAEPKNVRHAVLEGRRSGSTRSIHAARAFTSSSVTPGDLVCRLLLEKKKRNRTQEANEEWTTSGSRVTQRYY